MLIKKLTQETVSLSAAFINNRALLSELFKLLKSRKRMSSATLQCAPQKVFCFFLKFKQVLQRFSSSLPYWGIFLSCVFGTAWSGTSWHFLHFYLSECSAAIAPDASTHSQYLKHQQHHMFQLELCKQILFLGLICFTFAV